MFYQLRLLLLLLLPLVASGAGREPSLLLRSTQNTTEPQTQFEGGVSVANLRLTFGHNILTLCLGRIVRRAHFELHW